MRYIVSLYTCSIDNCTQEQGNLLESVHIEAGCIITGFRRASSKQKLVLN